MTIDDRIEIMRKLLNDEISKNNGSLMANKITDISKKLDELLIERYNIQKIKNIGDN